MVPGDLSKEDDANDLINKTMEHFGKLDILVSIALLFLLFLRYCSQLFVNIVVYL